MTTSFCCKVGRVVEEYNLDTTVSDNDVDTVLRARWKGTGKYTQTGVRALAEWLNKRLLRSVYTSSGRHPSEPRIAADYEALSSSDPLERAPISDELKADGINADRVVDSFISASTLYRHLTDCLDETKQPNMTESNWEEKKVEHARSVMQDSVSEALRSLENKNRIEKATEAEVSIPVLLGCPECSVQVRLETALRRGYVCNDHMDSTTTES